MTTWEPSWLARAARDWTAGGTAPLTARAWLASPVAYDARDAVTLDGALSWVVVADASGTTPDDAFADAPRDSYVTIPLPLARQDYPAGWVWCASSAQWPDGARDDVRKWRKRPHPETLGTSGKIVTAGGAYKALDLPVPTRVSPWVDFHVRADRDRLTALLRGIHALSRGRGGGLGAVDGWELLDDPADRSLVCDGRPMRPLPVRNADEAARLYAPGSYELRVCGVRPPYWHRAVKTLAAVPC